MRTLLLAFLSGIPALVYEVVWTREIALLAGSQVEAISLVLVAFFGGLALGARFLGARADRVASPLRFYAALEIAAGCGAGLSIVLLRAVGRSPLGAGSGIGQALLAAAILLPVTFLLGGTLPALLRSSLRDLASSARRAGWLLGANTAGSVLGVGAAVGLIPQLGLTATLLGAACGSAAIGLAALRLARGEAPPAKLEPRASATPRPLVLVAAGLAGVATLAFEVLAARMAMLRIGSSLYAWGAVLACFLLGLAAGNLAAARRAASTSTPERDLGWIQFAAASALAVGLFLLRPSLVGSAAGLVPQALDSVILGTLPAAILMGAAFPFFVRLAVAGPRVGAAFGAVSAVNTAGGIVGALLAPFVLLPLLGPVAGGLVCAAIGSLLGALFLARSAGTMRLALIRVGSGLACAAAAASLTLVPLPAPQKTRILHVDHGRQATAVVTSTAARRDLIVDGDPEASTGGNARRTEVLLASLPLLMHPDPHSFLELGLGSGITLGTAARFGLERVDCVEIAPTVIRAARYFAPDNGDATRHERVRIAHGDARNFLTHHPASYDVIVANTLHPWSVGATGLYSREYFSRIRRALRPGGIAAQWLPAERIGASSLTLILRSFYDVFPEGFLWWAAENLIALGSDTAIALAPEQQIRERLATSRLRPEALDISDASEIAQRRIGAAAAVRSVLGPGELLTDDRPLLEQRAALGAGPDSDAELLAVVAAIAELGLVEDRRSGPLLLWIESRQARAAGDKSRADGREMLAEQAGLALARRARIERRAARGKRALGEGRTDAAQHHFRAVLSEDPDQRDARWGLATGALERGELANAKRQLRRLLAAHPADAEAWNLLGAVHGRDGDLRGARGAFERALQANPFFPEALANAGLIASAAGDTRFARRMLERLRAISPMGTSPEEDALLDALRQAERRRDAAVALEVESATTKPPDG